MLLLVEDSEIINIMTCTMLIENALNLYNSKIKLNT